MVGYERVMCCMNFKKCLGMSGVGLVVCALSLLGNQRTNPLPASEPPVEGLAVEGWAVETVAGTGTAGFKGDGGPASQAEVNNPFGVVRGPDGAIWFCEYGGQRIRRITTDGRLETIAGSGEKGYSGDGGEPLQATFNLPHEIRFDKRGDLYIVDMSNHVVRKIDFQKNIVTTIAGTGVPGYSGDGGNANKAQLKNPHSIQFGPDGDLYICDIGNHVIRKVNMQNMQISTFAGTGKPGRTPDNSPLEGTPLNGPRSLDFDQAGNLWLATREGNQVFRLDLKSQRILHVAGTGASGFTGNGGPALQATLKGPKGIALDSAGNIYLADTESHTIRKIDAKSGTIEVLVGNGSKGDGPDGPPLNCQLNRLHGIFVDVDGSVWIGDSENHRIRVLRKIQNAGER